VMALDRASDLQALADCIRPEEGHR
jgi:hypothetical protein